MKKAIVKLKMPTAWLLSVFLVACGGGGGSSGDTDNPAVQEKKVQDSLSFENSEIEYYLHSDVGENPISGGSGTGDISYSSSNTTVVTVDASSGAVQLVAIGNATVRATKAGDAEYQPAEASYSIRVVEGQAQEPLVFESEALLVDLSVADTASNLLSGGSGDGQLVYSSSDDSVASVDMETGIATLVAEGTTVIGVTKAASGQFAAAHAEYRLTVTGPPDELSVELGKTDSTLSLNGVFAPTNIYRFTNQDCDVDNYASCSHGSMSVVSSSDEFPVTDDYIAVGLRAYVSFERAGLHSAPVAVDVKRPPFVRRMGHAMISFKGKLFVIAGQDNSAGESGNDTYWYNDIWSSIDGVNWQLETESAAFPGRAFHEVVEYENALYLIGGEEGIGTGGALSFKRDVWKSNDGVNWTRLVDRAPFMGEGKVAVFDGKIWVIGDSAFSGDSKIYSSTDGLNWDLELTESPFGSREDMAVYIWNEKLFVSGGMGPDGSDDLMNDVWSSPDGRTWKKESDDGGYPARVLGSVVGHNGRLLMVGGHSFSAGHNTVYKSEDGITWTLLAEDVITRMNQTHSLTAHASKLWLYSGLDQDYVWTSNDGEAWRVPVTLAVEWESAPE
ncbi:Ig-like domain-containing protein [Microbulbifer elongatus]|uniref:Ig-like domain-containing protein n=1 Tax=Microbulbifer elongatus TaxID=86173 RepID=UPI001E521F76|nr:Ig-like domain-containing protein [Microbulbifer elongatus]